MGSVAHVALVPRGVKVDMSEVANVAAAIAIQVVRDFTPVWGISATVSAFPKLCDVPVGYWPIFIEDPDQVPEGICGAHLDNRLQPYAIVKTSEQWSLDASHECLEMLVDPSGNRMQAGPMLEAAVQLGLPQHHVQYIVEVCDPVEDAQYAYQINGVMVSDFFTPSFYDPAPAAGVRYDFTGALSGPRDVVVNGFVSWLDPVTSETIQLQNFMGPDYRLHPQIVNLNQSDLFLDVLAREAYRPAIDRVTEIPNLFRNINRELQMNFETRHRAARHAAQINGRRMEQELQGMHAQYQEQVPCYE